MNTPPRFPFAATFEYPDAVSAAVLSILNYRDSWTGDLEKDAVDALPVLYFLKCVIEGVPDWGRSYAWNEAHKALEHVAARYARFWFDESQGNEGFLTAAREAGVKASDLFAVLTGKGSYENPFVGLERNEGDEDVQAAAKLFSAVQCYLKRSLPPFSDVDPEDFETDHLALQTGIFLMRFWTGEEVERKAVFLREYARRSLRPVVSLEAYHAPTETDVRSSLGPTLAFRSEHQGRTVVQFDASTSREDAIRDLEWLLEELKGRSDAYEDVQERAKKILAPSDEDLPF